MEMMSMVGTLITLFGIIVLGTLFVRFYPEIFDAIRFVIEKLRNM